MTRFWRNGETAVVRDVTPDGEILRALPFFVVADSPALTALYVPDGTDYMMAQRLSGTGPLSLCPRQMGPLRFRRDAMRLMFSNTGYAVYVQWDVAPRRFRQWYVNLEAPYRRTEIGFDTFDQELDIVVNPDLTWRWKDEDHLDALVEAGLFSAADREGVWRCAREAAGLLDRRESPFTDDWPLWNPPDQWGSPRLPETWATVTT